MIAYICGTIVSKDSTSVVLDVSGIGYRIFATDEALSALGAIGDSDVSVWTHLAVRENALDLYGFQTQEEVSFFEQLIGVPGIGPKSALSVLSLASVEELVQSIAAGDTTHLTKVSGIGKKTADKIVLELKDRVAVLSDEPHNLKDASDSIAALQSLGYTLKESREALKEVPEGVEETGERVREALKLLGKNN